MTWSDTLDLFIGLKTLVFFRMYWYRYVDKHFVEFL
jgi:hypothetical protein